MISAIVMFVFLTMILVLSFVPIQLSGFINIVHVDKFYHFFAFFCLTFPLSFVQPRLTIWVLLGVIVFGGLIELTQHLFGRQSTWTDFAADVIGALVGSLIAGQLGIWLLRRREHDSE